MNLIKADYIVIAAIVLYSITLFATNFYLEYKADVAEQINIERSVVLIAEQNPIARYFMLFDNLKVIYTTLVIPSFVIGIYWYFRSKYKDKDMAVVEGMAIMLFAGYLYNVLNDVSILLGALI